MVAKWKNDRKCFSRKNQYKGSLPRQKQSTISKEVLKFNIKHLYQDFTR